MIQPVVKPVVNRLNVCIHDTTGCQTGCQASCQTGLTTGCIPVWQPVVSCIQTFNWLSNPFDNPLTTGCIVYTAVCQTGCQTFVYTIQPVVKRVIQPVWQPVVSCKRGITMFSRVSRILSCIVVHTVAFSALTLLVGCKSIWPVISWVMRCLAWLSVCSKVQMVCMWSTWCHCHPCRFLLH